MAAALGIANRSSQTSSLETLDVETSFQGPSHSTSLIFVDVLFITVNRVSLYQGYPAVLKRPLLEVTQCRPVTINCVIFTAMKSKWNLGHEPEDLASSSCRFWR